MNGIASTKVIDADVSFRKQPFARPLKLSSGTITEITEATATVTIELDGKRSTGKGCIYLSDLWAWPDPSRSHEERDRVLRDLCEKVPFRFMSKTRQFPLR